MTDLNALSPQNTEQSAPGVDFNIDAARKIRREMRELEEAYGLVFLRKSLHEARFRYEALQRALDHSHSEPSS